MSEIESISFQLIKVTTEQFAIIQESYDDSNDSINLTINIRIRFNMHVNMFYINIRLILIFILI